MLFGDWGDDLMMSRVGVSGGNVDSRWLMIWLTLLLERPVALTILLTITGSGCSKKTAANTKAWRKFKFKSRALRSRLVFC